MLFKNIEFVYTIQLRYIFSCENVSSDKYAHVTASGCENEVY